MNFAEKHPEEFAEMQRLVDRLKRMLAAPRRHGLGRIKQATARLKEHDALCRDLWVDDIKNRFTPYRPDWQDGTFDRWGARDQRQLVARSYSGGNCLAACIGSMLGVDIAKVPDPTTVEYRQSSDWLPSLNDRLGQAVGHRLEEWPRALCPPRNPNELWIAGLEDVPDPHVVVCRGHFVVHDPAGELSGPLPSERLICGFRLIQARRVVPNISLTNPGFVTVSA